MTKYTRYIRRSFFTYTLAIIGILMVFITVFLLINTRLQIIGANDKNNKILAKKIGEEVSSYKTNLDMFCKSGEIKNVLKQEKVSKNFRISRLLYSFSNGMELGSNFILLDKDLEILSTNLFTENKEIFLKSGILKSLLEQINDDKSKIYSLPSRLNYTNEQEGDYILGKAILDGEKIIAYLFFEIRDEAFYVSVSSYPFDDVIITDRYNNLIFTLGRRNDDPMEKYPKAKYYLNGKENDTVKINNKEYNLQKAGIDNGNLVLYTLLETEVGKTLFFYSLIFLAALFLVMIVLLFPVTYRITDKNLSVIYELQKSVDEIGRGNMGYELKNQVFEEFVDLNNKYRKVVIQREVLLQRNSEISERKRIMEIKRLEERFNAHFIFNVLEVIRYEMMIDNAKASDMIIALASLMRYSINNKNTLVKWGMDLEYINDYLLLQKMRYNKRMSYSINVPEELYDCKIPKLILQPVVENALIHGMKSRRNINVQIEAKRIGEEIEIIVIDDGEGIDKSNLNKIRGSLQGEDNLQNHIGLYNAHRVIKLIYGGDYGVSIDSDIGVGTKVSLRMPIEMEE